MLKNAFSNNKSKSTETLGFVVPEEYEHGNDDVRKRIAGTSLTAYLDLLQSSFWPASGTEMLSPEMEVRSLLISSNADPRGEKQCDVGGSVLILPIDMLKHYSRATICPDTAKSFPESPSVTFFAIAKGSCPSHKEWLSILQVQKLIVH